MKFSKNIFIDKELKKRNYFLVFLAAFIMVFFIFIFKANITGLAFGVPDENNFSYEINNINNLTIEDPVLNENNKEIIEDGLKIDEQDNIKENSNSENLNVKSQNFNVKANDPNHVNFLPYIPNNTEIRYLGYKHSNYSNIVISTKEHVECSLKPDSINDGWKNCTAIFEIQNLNTSKYGVLLPGIIWNHTNANRRNGAISFSNISNLVNESYRNFIVVTNGDGETIAAENITTFEKNNYTNFTAMPSALDTSTPFAIKLNYEVSEFTGNQFNLSLIGSMNAYIDPSQSGCGSLNTAGIYTLSQSVNSTGTCFTIGASNVELNCNGFTVNYSTSGTTGNFGLDNTASYHNLTVKYCNIFNGNGTPTATAMHGIVLVGSQNSTIAYNNFTIEGNQSHAVLLNTSSLYNNISFNVFNITIKRSTVTSFAVDIENSNNNTIEGNIMFTNSSEGAATRINVANNNFIINNLMNGTGTNIGGRMIRCTDGDFNVIYKNTIHSIQNFQGNSIWLLRCSDNNISYNNINIIQGNQSKGIFISGTTKANNNNTFWFNRIYNTATEGIGYGFDTGSNNTIISTNITLTAGDGLSYAIRIREGNATFINSTFDRTAILFDPQPNTNSRNGTLVIKWYATFNVSNYLWQGLNNANITSYNNTFNLLDNTTTNLNGTGIYYFVLTEYFRNVNAINYHTPHRINSTALNYNDNFTILNLTAESNPADFSRTIYMLDSTNPTVSISSSLGNSIYESSTTRLTCNANDANGVATVTMSSGSNICSSSGSSCSANFNHGAGTAVISCTAKDIFGNSGSNSLSLNIAKNSGGSSSSASSTTGSGNSASEQTEETSSPENKEEIIENGKNEGSKLKRETATSDIPSSSSECKGDNCPEKEETSSTFEKIKWLNIKDKKILNLFLFSGTAIIAFAASIGFIMLRKRIYRKHGF